MRRGPPEIIEHAQQTLNRPRKPRRYQRGKLG
jgi:hypothetical protein